MTKPRTNPPPAADNLPLPVDKIHAALEQGVRRVAGAPDLEDLVQQAWVALLGKRRQLETVSPKALPAYIRRLGQHAAIDALRSQSAVKRGRRVDFVSTQQVFALPSRGADPETTAIARIDLRTAVARASASATTHRLLTLIFLRGLTPEAAAAHLGLALGSVYSSLSRARARLAANRR